MRKEYSGVFTIVLLFASVSVFGQTPKPSEWLKEINRDVWQPFMEGVGTFNDNLYTRVRSQDYIRIDPGSKMFLNRTDYDDDSIKIMHRYKEEGRKLRLSVRFTDRIVNGEFAFERGVNEFVMETKDGESRRSYARFQTVLRKENGVWRMLTEYFPPESATEEDYKNASALDDLSKFRCYMPYPQKKVVCEE